MMQQQQMSQGQYPYVVLGGGNAAGYIARAFSKLGCQGKLRIISEESTLPYERSALTKGLLERERADASEFLTASQNEQWYKEQNFDVRLNTRVTSVDLQGRILHSPTGDIPFQKLIVATGSSLAPVRIPGGNLGGVHCLRWYDTGKALAGAINAAKNPRREERSYCRAVVIGNDYIAMESAASVAMAGLETILVLEGDRLLPDLFPQKISEEYETFFERKGVRIIKEARVQELLPRTDTNYAEDSGMIGSVKLSNGEELRCSVCVIIPKMMPRVGLFRGMLEIDQATDALLVDSHLRTSNRDIYAVGDVCAFPSLYDGKPGRWARHDHAIRSAHYVAYSVLADELNHSQQLEDYWYLPHTSSLPFDRAWDFFGRPLGECFIIGSLFDNQSGFAALFVGPEKRVEGVFLESGADKDLQLISDIALLRLTLNDEHLEQLRTIRDTKQLMQLLHWAYNLELLNVERSLKTPASGYLSQQTEMMQSSTVGGEQYRR